MLKRLKGLRLVLFAAGVAMLLVSVAQAAPIGTLKQFRVPTANGNPKGITQASDGNFWFTESHVQPPQSDNHHVGQITPAGAVTEFLVCQFCFPNDIVQGSDGVLYFTSNEAALGRITTSGQLLPFVNPTEPLTVIGGGIAAGGGNIYFTDFNNDSIWQYNVVSGAFTRHVLAPSQTADRVPDDVAVDAAGFVWFTDFGANLIGRLDPATGAITETPLPDAPNGPRGIAIATDEKVWFTKRFDNSVGFLDPAAQNGITIFPLAAGRGPEDIAAAPDGSVWFAQSVAGNIARITSAGVITESKAIKNSGPFGITVATDGNPWFTELDANKIAALLLR